MFNAIKYTKDLMEAGFSQKQAEATINMLYFFSEDNLATRHDLKELEYRLTVKMGLMNVAVIGILGTLMKVL